VLECFHRCTPFFQEVLLQISITFKNLNSSDAVKSHIHDKFDRLDKMLDYQSSANVVLSEEKLRSIAEVNLVCDSMKIHAREESDNNMYAAIDACSDKLRSQIRKFKDKQRRHLAGDKQSIKLDAMEDSFSTATD
jgi:putative sigma-54 modulation protein